MANVPRGAPKGKKSFEVFEDVTIDDLTVATGLTMGTGDSLTVDTIAAIAGKELLISGSTTLDVEVKLGEAAGATDFHVADSAGVELFKVDSSGVVTLEGGATLNNSAAADTLTVTETNIALAGAVTCTSIAPTAITLPSNSVAQAAVADDAIGVAELKVVQRDVTIANLAQAGSVTNAADIGGIILGAYPESACETAILDVTLSQVSGEITVTLGAAQAGGDAHVTVNVLQA